MPPPRRRILVALIGNPNVGKSVVFNNLTGMRQFVGNWPGKTVERREGILRFGDYEIRVVDLPGVYSLSALSEEEEIAVSFILHARPDVVVDIVDASTLERNLYLLLQLLELTPNVIVLLNKIDMAEAEGIKIDIRQLEQTLGVPVIPAVAIRNIGMRALIEKMLALAEGRVRPKPLRIDYGPRLEQEIAELQRRLTAKGCAPHLARWLAIRALERDPLAWRELSKLLPEAELRAIRERIDKLDAELGGQLGELIIERRYAHIGRIVSRCLSRGSCRKAPALALALDRVALHPVIGPLLALFVFFVLFVLVFGVNVGFPLSILLSRLGFRRAARAIEEFNLASLIGDRLFGALAERCGDALRAMGAPDWLVSLLADGLIPGLGAVFSFFPMVLTLFVLLGFLEDSGYMARAAFTLDRFLRRAGLSGRAFLPLMLGFGCNVPATVGMRILPSGDERRRAIVVNPFIPCQARLAVFMLMAAAFFREPWQASLAVLLAYALALALVLIASWILMRAVFRSEPSPLLIELPPFQRPSLRVVLWFAWERSLHFLKKAGSIILGASILIWYLLNYGPSGAAADPSGSWAALIGRSLAPLFAPLGFGRWEVVIALLAGLLAKETIPETVALAMKTADPVAALRALALPLPSAAALMVFTMLYMPCVATLAAIAHEGGSARLALLSLILSITFAYAAALLARALLLAIIAI